MDLLRFWVDIGAASEGAARAAENLTADIGDLAADLRALSLGLTPDDLRADGLSDADPWELERVSGMRGIAEIWAAGLWLPPWSHNEARVALFVDAELAPEEGAPLSRTPAGELAERLRLSVPPDVLAVGLEFAEERAAAPGQAVSLLGQTSTLGCRVLLDNGRRAITTAGHAAPQKKLVAKVAGARIGVVVDTSYLDATPPGKDCADLAVIELDDGVPEPAGVHISGEVAAAPGDDVIVHAQAGQRAGWVRGIAPSWLRDRNAGGWGNVVIIERCVTKSGDSGTPVTLSDGSDRIVGHVVAGARSYTLVQDVGFQLSGGSQPFAPALSRSGVPAWTSMQLRTP